MAKLKDFFEGRRRKCELQVFNVLKNKAGERRIKLFVVMPLSGEPVTGTPDLFTEPYLLMQKENSSMNLSKIDVELDGAALDIFSTDTIASPAVKISGATLQDFRMMGDGCDDKRKVSLEFSIYMPYTMPLRDWGCDHIHAEFFVEVTPSQMEIPAEEPKAEEKPEGKKKNQQAELVQ